MAKFSWNDTSVNTLTSIVGSNNGSEISKDAVVSAAEQLETTTSSIAAKLRHMGYTVASLAATKSAAFSTEEGQALADFVQNNAGTFTYAEIAENFMGGKFTAKQVQGKLLALELTGMVKRSEPKTVVKTYSDAEEAQFIEMANQGKFLEEIADALGKTVNSVRGKGLSLSRKGLIPSIPKQRDHKPQEDADVIGSLNVEAMTVAQIAEATGKTERGVKTILTKRSLTAVDYDGAAKAAKAAAKAEAA